MRPVIALLFCIFTGFVGAKKTTMSNEFNGTWIPVKQEMNGLAIPGTDFQNQRLILSDSNYTYFAESTDKGVAIFNAGKLDLYGKEGVNTGKHFTAIYKLENGLLTICYNLSGDSYPESFDTKGKQMFFLCVFKRKDTK
jgi:uncharacterized protein (TIGR03067 family)